jgi:hypothetical protein
VKLANHLDTNNLHIFNIANNPGDGTSAIPRSELVRVEDDLAASIAGLQVELSAAINKLDIKDSCVVVATSEISLVSPPATIQGVTLDDDMRVLVAGQTDKTTNGIYVMTAGSLVRSDDANANDEVTSGMAIPVRGGEAKNVGLWILETADPIALGTSELSFIRQRNLYDLTVGDSLVLSGSSYLELLGVANSIDITETGIQVSPNYVGGTAISTLGTIITGTWNGTTIGLGNGGTNATTAAQARVNLGVAEEYSTLIGDGTTTSFTVTHSLNNLRVLKPSTVEVSSGTFVEATYRRIDANSVEVKFGQAPVTNGVEVIVMGVKKA